MVQIMTKPSPKIKVRLYRRESGFVNIDMPDGKAPKVGSQMTIGGVPWKVTMVEYPITGRLPPEFMILNQGLTRLPEGARFVDEDEDDREDKP